MTLIYLSYEVRRPPRWNTFLAGLAIDGIGLLLLIAAGSRLNNSVPIQTVAINQSVTLVAPTFTSVTRRAPRRIPAPARIARLQAPRPLMKTPAPLIADAKPPQPPKIESPKPDFPRMASSAALPPKPAEIKTNVFGVAKSESASTHHPPRQVQTGGFGDPNGVSGHADPSRNTVTVASIGSFELPQGPDKGNGTGGAHGVSGTVRAAGFSNVSASETGAPQGRGNGVVVAGGFGDRNSLAQGGAAAPQTSTKPALQPVEIVFKPRPAYTQEARRRGVEGEVLLDVVFSASGLLHVNRVVKGLGYGLDDSALAAAQRIQFRPARRDGQPYDCAALVHIVFELSE